MAESYPIVPQVVYHQINETIDSQSECTKREAISNTPIESLSDVRLDPHELETSNSRLGDIVEVPVYVPRYGTCHTSIVATGKKGSAPGQLLVPSGVAIHEDTHHIFIANLGNNRVEIFSETGEFLYQLGVGQLSEPYGIATHGDSVYVSCLDRTINKFSLTEICLVRRIGGFGQFINLTQLTTDPIGRVVIADAVSNKRICVHDPNLNHLRNIESILHPWDIKVSRNRLYVLCSHNSPCMHVLTLEGEKIHSLFTCGKGMDMLDPWFFCFDPLNNFVMSDFNSHSIRIFSPEGNLLHTIGRKGDQPGMFRWPRGIAITPNGRLVCVSVNKFCGLQIFY